MAQAKEEEPNINIEDHKVDSKLLDARDYLFEILSKRWVMAVLTVVPVFAIFSFVNLFPILWGIYGSFNDISAFAPGMEFVALENYVRLANDSRFWASMYRSVIFAVGSVSLQLVVGVGFALLLNRSFKYANLSRTIGMLPYLIPTAVLGFLAGWMGNAQFGIINQVLFEMGIISEYIAWYGSYTWSMFSVIVTSSWKLAMFVTIMVLARLQGIPDEFYEAAEMSGASSWQVFRDITLPNLKNVIFIVLLLRGVWQFTKFDIIYILTRGGPGSETTTAPIYAYQVGFPSAQLGFAAAIATVLFGMLIVFAILYFHILEPSKEVRVE